MVMSTSAGARRLPRLVVAAPASGHGKTTIACGLMAAMRRRGLAVAPAKVGPDYIDPGYHWLAAGRVGRNLDPVLVGEDRIVPLLLHGAATPQPADVSVIEGVMGLFDGRLASDGFGSSAHVATLTASPVLLVVDVRHASRTFGAVVHGLATYDPGVRVGGVLLNRVGSVRHAQEVRRAVEGVGLPVLGVLPRDEAISAPSRHLGLVPAAERAESAAVLDALADRIAADVDLDAVLALARTAPDLMGEPWDAAREMSHAREAGIERAGSGDAGSSRPVIAMAGGRAFTFRYAETEELLRAGGCEVVTFDPLTDAALPPGTAGLYVGGGFPQVHAADLTANAPLREHIRDAVASGLPTVAECAGLLYLCDSVDGAPMLGALPLTAAMTSKLTLGYRQAIAPADTLLARAGERLVGHEFHRTTTAPLVRPEDNSPTHEDADVPDASDVSGVADVPGVASAWLLDGRAEGASVDPAGLGHPTVHASYLHTHWAGRPQLASRFVDAVRDYAGSGRAVPDAPRGVPSTSARPVPDQLPTTSAAAAADASARGVGEVILVGGGPGDPGLLTVAGLEAIRAADAVVYDRLAPLASLAEAPAGAELIEVGKIPRGAFTSQERIHEILIEQALAGRRVVRLKGGDPFVFGRGGEEWQACAAAGVPVRVIPGVTSCVAVPELAGVPVTHRHLTQGFTVVSGHVPPGDPRSSLDWDALARTHTTLVILMGVKNLPKITARLVGAGLDPASPAVVLEDGCSTAARVVRGSAADIAALAADAGVRPPAITVIGQVAGLDLDVDG